MTREFRSASRGSGRVAGATEGPTDVVTKVPDWRHAAVRRCPALVFTCLAIVGCSEPLELSDWTLPLPEDVPVQEYRVAALDGREGDRIEIVTDLVISGATGDDEASFYEPRALVVDEDGRMRAPGAGLSIAIR